MVDKQPDDNNDDNDNNDINDINDINNKNNETSSSSFGTTTTGTLSDRLRQIRDNILVKVTQDDYSHKYSLFGGPVDRWNRCYLSFCFLGVCTLLPWNFFMSANAYWNYKFRNTTDIADVTDWQEKFETYLAIAAFIPNVFILLLASLLTKVFSAKSRLLTSSLFMGLIFTGTAALVLVDTDEYQYTFFIGTLVSVVFINGSSAVMQSGVFGLAGLLPQRFMQGVMHGQAMGATIAALASILTLAVGENEATVRYATFGYFVLGSLVMFMAAVVSIAALKSNYLSFTLERSQSPTLKEEPSSRRSKYGVNADVGEQEGLLGRGGGGGGDVEGEEAPVEEKIKDDEELSSAYGASVPAVSTRQQINGILGLFRKIAPEAFSVYITFAITISVFPGIIVLIAPVNASETSSYTKFFSAVFCFFLFNFGDLIGRTLAGKVQLPRARSPRWVLPLVCMARLLFIPAFMFCNVQVASTSVRNLSTVFNHDAWFIAFMIVFSISNGYFASLAMMFGPKRVFESQAEMAGSIMATFLAWGLATGAGLTYLVLGLI